MAASPAAPFTPVVDTVPAVSPSPNPIANSPQLQDISTVLASPLPYSPSAGRALSPLKAAENTTALTPLRPLVSSPAQSPPGSLRSPAWLPSLTQLPQLSPLLPTMSPVSNQSPLPALETPPRSSPAPVPVQPVPVQPVPVQPVPVQPVPVPTNLTTWLSEYPTITDPNLSGKLASLAEFAVLSGQSTETPPQPGQLYSHQQLFQRLYDVYDKVLVMDAPGTGKTCLTSALTEHLKRIYRANADLTPSLLKPPLYKRAFVLGRGDIIKLNFRNELACRCTKGVYEIPELARLTEKSRQTQISKEIAKYYTISTYSTFAQVVQPMSDQQLINQFEGCVFIIDEAHNLIPRSALAAGEIDLIGAAAPSRPRRRIQANGTSRRQPLSVQETYNILHRLFHVVKRCKIILLTATPARAEAVSEFSFLVNFLRPLDSQMPYGPPDMDLNQFASWLRGYVSYVRELDTGVDFAFQGYPLSQIIPADDYLTTVVKPLMMSPFQSQAYAAAYAQHGNRDFFEEVRQAANMVYPDSSYGKAGFNRYVVNRGRGLWSFTNEMLAAVAAAAQIYPDNLIYQFSTKFADLAAMIINYHGQGKKGYIYQEFKKGSGAIPLGLMLEQVGIERFYMSESAFRGNTVGLGGGGCNVDTNVAGRTITIDKKLRYGLLTPDNPTEINRAMMEVFNSPENRHAEYIAVLVFSPVGKEGISLLDIQWMAENPAWLWPSAKQSIFRGRRATSQVALLAELRRTSGNPQARLPLDVNLLAAYPDQAGTLAIDFYIYQQAELAARRNAPFIEAARAVASDCWLEINRNVRATDAALAGTPECDYGNCVYQCASEAPLPPDQWDYSGLIRKYASGYRDQIYNYVKAAMAQDFAIALDQVVTDLVKQGVPRPVVLVELSSIVEEARPVLNRFGQLMYLQLSGGYLVVTPDYPVGPIMAGQSAILRQLRQISQLDYLSSLPAVRRQNLESYLRTDQASQLPQLLPLLQGEPNNLLATLDTLSIRERAFLLERAVENYFTGQATVAVTALLQHYQPKLFAIAAEPVEQIRERIALVSRSRAAHKPVPPAPTLLASQAGPVYLHTLLALEANKLIRYSLATRSLKPVNIRLYFPAPDNTGPGLWRDANWVEELVYQDIVKRTIQARETEMIAASPWSLDGIYGYIILDDPKDELRIVDPINQNQEDQELGLVGAIEANNSDSRYDRRGLVCGTWKKQDLAVLAYKMGLLQLAQPNNYDTMDQIDIILLRNHVNLRQGTEEESRFVAGWLEPGPQSRSVVIRSACEAIRERFIQLGLLAVR